MNDTAHIHDSFDPRPRVDTAGLSPKATELANRLAADIGRLSEAQLDAILAVLAASPPLKQGRLPAKK